MKDDLVIKVDHVSKKFCRDLKKSLWYGVQDVVHEMLPFGRGTSGTDRTELRPKEFYAVNDVSFELRRGQCLGLIGRNGAGKTTLLKMLNGLIKPDGGRIEMRGRVGALIALGAGFNPILTGRENIYVNGSVLGLSKKEVSERFDEIVDFADLWDFINTPVQSYSSGMRVRLGFAVASALNPDILLVDEVLAVGDFSFRQKCLKRIADFRESGGSVILVSHNINQIQSVCNVALYLKNGSVRFGGDVFEAANTYFEDTIDADADKNRAAVAVGKAQTEEPIRIEKVEVFGPEGAGTDPGPNERVSVVLHVNSDRACDALHILLLIFDKEMALRFATLSTDRIETEYKLGKGNNVFRMSIKHLPLAPGNYAMKVILRSSSNQLPLAQKGFEDQPVYFKVAIKNRGELNLASQNGDLLLLELE